jgi:cytochrome P450
MVHAPDVGPIAFARGARSRAFLDFAGDLWREHGDVFEALIAERRSLHEMDWPNDLLSRLMEARDPTQARR